MHLLVGLGNPGEKYAKNRHNVGFMALDRIHERHGFSPWRSRFSGEVSEGRIGSHKVMLLKPETFMNLSGQAAGEAMRYFKLEPEDVIVIHDELDLDPGRVRIKRGGGHGGHNGLKSLDAHIGKDYQRIRIGIGHPGAKPAVAGYVLKDFPKADEAWREALLDTLSDDLGLMLDGKPSDINSRLNAATAPHREKAEDIPANPASKAEPKPSAPATPQPERKAGPMADMLKNLFGGKS